MKLMAIVTLFCCSIVFASARSDIGSKNQPAIDVKKIESLAISYQLAQYKKQKMSFVESLNRGDNLPPGCDPHHPPPPQNSNQCIDIVCEKLGSFGCDQQSEITAVAAACRGVDPTCVESTCNRLGSFGCDQMSEITDVTNTCRQVFDGRCMDVACDHLGTFGCDQMSEIKQVAALCKGRVDADCIQSVCQRLGSFGCDQLSELQQVAKSCGGN
jgi:hypothetical protein